jgi:hypothetical protein
MYTPITSRYLSERRSDAERFPELSPRHIAENEERTRVYNVILQGQMEYQREHREAERLKILTPGRDGRLSAAAELLLSRERAEKDEKDRIQQNIVAANHPYHNEYNHPNQYSSETMRREISDRMPQMENMEYTNTRTPRMPHMENMEYTNTRTPVSQLEIMQSLMVCHLCEKHRGITT